MLLVGKFYDGIWWDPLISVIESFVILRWAYTLCRDTAWELLDEIGEQIEKDGHRVLDLHVWNSGPSNVVCILSVIPGNDREGFRRSFAGFSKGLHLVVKRAKWSFLGSRNNFEIRFGGAQRLTFFAFRRACRRQGLVFTSPLNIVAMSKRTEMRFDRISGRLISRF